MTNYTLPAIWFVSGGVLSVSFFIFLCGYILNKIPYKLVFEPKLTIADDTCLVSESSPRRKTVKGAKKDYVKKGWIKVSNNPLNRTELNWRDLSPPPLKRKKSLVDSSLNILSSSREALTKVLGRETKKQSSDPSLACMNCFGVLWGTRLTLYDSEALKVVLDEVEVPQFSVGLYPDDLADYEIYLRDSPIQLLSSDPAEVDYFIYAPSGSDKEDWYLLLRRASFSTRGESESEPMKAYIHSMDKLLRVVKNPSPKQKATAWLNAILGRIFVGIHASPRIKNWLMNKLNRRSVVDSNMPSFLSDIEIQELYLGNSVPILSNPMLLDISVDGDMNLAMDIEYSGGIRLQAATHATITVPSLNNYVKPIEVPMVVAIKIKYFSARVLLKIKPYWESGRVWFGFYRNPPIKLSLEVEPVISNKLVRLELVNQIIESRIKEALNDFFVLPNMDDLPFWPADGVGAIFEDEEELSSSMVDFDESDGSQEIQEGDGQEMKDGDPEGINLEIEEDADASTNEMLKPLLASSSESINQDVPQKETSKPQLILQRVDSSDFEAPDASEEQFDGPAAELWKNLPEPPQILAPYVRSTLSALSQSAAHYNIDTKLKGAIQTAHEYGLDDTAKSIADTAVNVGTGVFEYIKKTTPIGSPKRPTPVSTESKRSHSGPSTVFELFGLSIATSPPISPGVSPSRRPKDTFSPSKRSSRLSSSYTTSDGKDRNVSMGSIRNTSLGPEMFKRRSLSLSGIPSEPTIEMEPIDDGLHSEKQRSSGSSEIVPQKLRRRASRSYEDQLDQKPPLVRRMPSRLEPEASSVPVTQKEEKEGTEDGRSTLRALTLMGRRSLSVLLGQDETNE